MNTNDELRDAEQKLQEAKLENALMRIEFLEEDVKSVNAKLDSVIEALLGLANKPLDNERKA